MATHSVAYAMEEMKTIWQTIIAVCGGVITALLGEWNIALEILLILMVIDYITGVAVAAKTKTLRSSVGFDGIIRKAAMFMVIIVAAQLDRIAGTDGFFKSATAFFFVANEGLSILENVGALGIHIPAFIKDRLEQLRKAGDAPEEPQEPKE